MNVRPISSERSRFMVSGAIGLVLVVALVALGIKAAFGAFAGGYELHGTFAAAGQGLLEGSDVKVRGVNIGEVDDIELVENRARITLRIDDGTRIPETAQAVIRPKTLFGEKFVDLDLGPDELRGPYLDDGDEITDTLGGFELERVLAEAYPILEAIDPAEVAVVLDELATAGEGLGENINRSIVNGATLARLQASNDGEVRQFLGDLALLSEELDRLAPDLLDAADDLNAALPTLNERGDLLNAALVDLAGISADVADLLEANRDFTDVALTDGSKALQILFDKRSRIQPLLLGVERYTQTIAEVIRVEVGDGTLMAAIKNIFVPPTSHGAAASADRGTPQGGGGAPGGPLPDVGEAVDGATGGATGRGDGSGSLLDLLLGGVGR